MKERPILYSAPMVKAKLANHKTQTRRLVTNKFVLDTLQFLGGGPESEPATITTIGQEMAPKGLRLWCAEYPEDGSVIVPCPYGMPNDRLWGRETFSTDFSGHYPHDPVWYKADDDRGADIEVRDGVRGIYSPESGIFVPFKWRPSIFMPRRLCRILDEIVSIRVERLQDIRDDDAIAEGITFLGLHEGNDYWGLEGSPPSEAYWTPKAAYQALWDSINAQRGHSWKKNEWVWVIETRSLLPRA